MLEGNPKIATILAYVSRAGLSSPPTCQLRQGGKNDAVVQQLMEIIWNTKLYALVMRRSFLLLQKPPRMPLPTTLTISA